MSFPAYNFVAVPYQGPIFGVPVNLCSTASNTNSSGHQSKIVNLSFDWVNTYPTQAVTVNMQSTGATPPLDQILMVYVDNTQNTSNIAIVVPDSQQVINVPMNSSGYFPVLTTGNLFTVYNGLNGLLVPNGSTSIIVCNFAIPGFLANEIPILFSPSAQLIGVSRSLAMAGTVNGNVAALPILTAPHNYVITSFDLSLAAPAVAGASGVQLNISLLFNPNLVAYEYNYWIGPGSTTNIPFPSFTLLASYTGLLLQCTSMVMEYFINPTSNNLTNGYLTVNAQYYQY